MSVRNQKKQATSAINKLVEKHKTPSKLRPKGRMTPEISAFITDDIPRIFALTQEEALAELDASELPKGDAVDVGPMEDIKNMARRIVAIQDETSVADLERLLVSLNDIIVLGKGIRKANLFRRASLIFDLKTRVLDGIDPLISAIDVDEDGQTITDEVRTGKKVTGKKLGALAEFGLNAEGALLGQSGSWKNILARILRTDDTVAVKAILNELSMFDEARANTRGTQDATNKLQTGIMQALNMTDKGNYLRTMQDMNTQKVFIGNFRHATRKGATAEEIKRPGSYRSPSASSIPMAWPTPMRSSTLSRTRSPVCTMRGVFAMPS